MWPPRFAYGAIRMWLLLLQTLTSDQSVLLYVVASYHPRSASHRGDRRLQRREFHVRCLRPGSSGVHNRLPADPLLGLPDIVNECLQSALTTAVKAVTQHASSANLVV